VTAVATDFSKLDLHAGERVGVQLPSDLTFIVSYLALMWLGCSVVPLDPRLSLRDRSRYLDAAKASGLIAADGPAELVTSGDIRRMVERPAPATAVPRVMVTREAVVFYTSGTTGQPKAVCHSHRNVVLAADRVNELERTYFSGPLRDRAWRLLISGWRQRRRLRSLLGQQAWMTTLGYHTIGGHAVLMAALLGGRRLVCAPTTHPRIVLDTIKAQGVTTLATTPATAELLVRAAAGSARRFPSLAVVGLGSSPVTPALVQAVRAAFGCEVVVGYGSTELGGGVLATRIEDPRDIQDSTVGRPFPHCDVRIVDSGGRELPPGTAGELVCRTNSLMSSYDGEGHRDTVVDGWYHTGDLAIMSDDGYVRVLARFDDVVNRAGVKVPPREVEEVVEAHPEVLCACAIGVPVERAVGVQLWAFIETTRGDVPLDLRATCLQMLGPAKCPDRFIAVSELPRTENGELDRSAIRQEAQGHEPYQQERSSL
jgi:acyl-CoA synthetase (AMP-forming)/AMP-acid ligase II